MKIAAFDVEKWERESLKILGKKNDLEMTEESLSPENAGRYSDAQVITTFIYSELGRETLDQFENLELIATRSTGYDHIDLKLCRERGIKIAFVPSYGENTVAEHAFGLLLAISRRMEEAIDRTRKGDFSPQRLTGFDLKDRTFGVIGTGDIGLNAARIARGFDMDVLAFDVRPDHDASHRIGFRYVSLDELLKGSDVISLHVPETPETRNMLSGDEFRKMKKGVILINTARGALVDSTALIRALAEGKVAGAGLDVLAQEPVIREECELLRAVFEDRHDLRTLLADEVLIRMQNVVVTPHSAFNTKEALRRLLNTTVENILSFEEGSPINIVDLSKQGAA